MMDDVDQWLAEAAKTTSVGLSNSTADELESRLVAAGTPSAFAARRDAQRTMLSAGIAALFTFTATGTATAFEFAQSEPTWLAAPSASSPSRLLIGR